jgi:putative redox protein
MKHEIVCAWKGGMAFEADILGHPVRMDADAQSGGTDSGARPKPLLLAALAGCTGMDVVSLLEKMRQPLSFFDMKVEGDLTEEHPKRYAAMVLVYRFKASDGLDPEKVLKAVTLSQEKYCGVSATLRGSVELSWRIEYL